MEQLTLTHDELTAIGFTKQTTIADELNPARDFYIIPCINGYFYYNPNEVQYRWYQKFIIEKSSNDIHLDITKKAELYAVLSCFKVKYNLVF